MSIVCAKNFAKIIERPHRPRMRAFQGSKSPHCNDRLRRTANAERPSPQTPYATKNTFRILEKTRRNPPWAANRNTISILILSPRTIIPCSSAAFRAERSLCNTNRIHARRRASGQDPARLSADARMSECEFNHPPKKCTPPLEPLTSSPSAN